MAPQRRTGSRAAEGSGAGAGARAGERRRLSGIKNNVQKDSRRKWLKVAFLLSSAMLGYLLTGSYLLSEDGVAEVLAHRGESLQYKFIEIPCSEDYDSHKRFEENCEISMVE